MKRDEAFWAKVDKSGDCWVWTGYRSPLGYGELRRRGQKFYAHRYALMQDGVSLVGVVDHLCHNPSCVRPSHLCVVTVKQNIENRGRLNKNNTSGHRGVSQVENGWRGSVKHNYKIHTKTFADIESAHAWVVSKRAELFTHSDLDQVI